VAGLRVLEVALGGFDSEAVVGEALVHLRDQLAQLVDVDPDVMRCIYN
jgi:hypothetical protein